MNTAAAYSRDAKPLDGPDDTDVDEEISSDEDYFDGGLDARVEPKGRVPVHPHGGAHWCTFLPPPIRAALSVLHPYFSGRYYLLRLIR